MKNIKVKIEIPLKSNIKYEYDFKTKEILVDRILRDGFRYPANYGCLPEALDWDGDPLDVLVYSELPFTPGVVVNARIIGAMRMIDDGETDTKLIAVHSDDYHYEHINSLNDLPEAFLKDIKVFFETYKNWKRPNITKVPGFENKEWAVNDYFECVKLMDKYGSLSKKDFISKMKSLHPEKYTT